MSKVITTLFCAVSLAIGLVGNQAWASPVLYAATGSNHVRGELVILNQANGAVATDIGALVDVAGNHYGLTGLAFQPSTGVLFGATTGSSGMLVTIDPSTALVTVVGSFFTGGSAGQPMADITFDPTSGTLYGDRNPSGGNNPDLFSINLTTGAASLVGPSGFTFFTQGGGLASDATGTIFGVPNKVNDVATDSEHEHPLVTYDKTTGAATSLATLSPNLFASNTIPTSVIQAMDFDPTSGTLFAINASAQGVSQTHLVTINTTTGVITDLGSSLNNVDALAFTRPAGPTTNPVPEPATFLLLGSGLVGLTAWRRKQTA